MRRNFIVSGIAGAAALAGIAWAQMPSIPPTPPMPAAEAAKLNAWDFNLVAIDGAPLPMKQFRGKVVLLVNTASFCGLGSSRVDLQACKLEYSIVSPK